MTGRPRPALARTGWLPLLLGALVLAGCAAIPTDGPVRAGADAPLDESLERIDVEVAPPRRGADPREIVSGFQLAAQNYELNSASARSHLADELRRTWSPEGGVVVYQDSVDLRPPQALGPDRAVVTAELEQVARIDGDGRYAPVSGPDGEPRTALLDYELVRQFGEWRISSAPAGLVLSEATVQRSYQPYAVYFVGHGGDVLVPDLRLLPERSNLASFLTRELLEGPSPELATAGVGSAFPPGTALTVPSVPVTAEGVARVDFGASVLEADPEARRVLSAQLVHTLRQVPQVAAVRVAVDGQPLEVPGARDDGHQGVGAWTSFAADVLPPDARAYAVQDGRLATVADGTLSPVSGLLGSGAEELRTPAVDLGEQRVAFVTQAEDGAWLLKESALRADSPAPEILRSDTPIAPPSWDRTGRLWTVIRGTVQAQLMNPDLPGSGRWLSIPVSLPDGLSPVQVRVSRDGARAAVVAAGPEEGTQLWVGVVSRSEDGTPLRVADLRRLAADVAVVRDVAWADATSVAVVGYDDEQRASRPQVVSIDGYDVDRTRPIAAAAVAAAPDAGQPLVVEVGAEGEQQLWVQRSGDWVEVGPGSGPAYPG